jgi:hypothetical protein
VRWGKVGGREAYEVPSCRLAGVAQLVVGG